MHKQNLAKITLGVLVLTLLGFVALAFPSDSSAQAPRNIVIIMTDDQDTDSLPVMRKLMAYPESSWVNFKNAFVTNSLCCPSRSSILSGQYAIHHGVLDNDLGANFDDSNALPVWLDNAGYRNGLIGKYLNGHPWDKGSGYIPPEWDYFNTARLNADSMTNTAVNFINTSGTEPFFFISCVLRTACHSPSPSQICKC